ncbi:MAG: LysM peptidoglycan-binding domain-containing protein, partial [Caldilineae bacterium]
VQPGDTLFAIATRFGVRMSRLAEANHIADVNWIAVGQVLVIPAERSVAEPLPPPFEAVTLSEDPVEQGRTLVVFVTLAAPAELDADWEGRPVFLAGDGQHYWGIVGVHALSEVGFHELHLRAALPDGSTVEATRPVRVVEGPYGTETIQVDASRQGLLEPSVVQAEAERVRAVWSQVTPRKWWEGPFRYPVEPSRITSAFGTRRSYGGGPVNGFHAGTDFGGGVGTPIYAPAPGVVVLAEPLDVRGNAVIIDHGMGLFSGYWHQSRLAVQTGDVVAPGDLIGYIGDTGLVTGPHLHWEMRLGGIAVDPLQWVTESIP